MSIDLVYRRLMSQRATVLVLAAGDPGMAVDPPPHGMVIAADSGLDLAESLGLSVDVVVGDMDSVSPQALARAESLGLVIQRHPRAKDQTDLELAMATAMSTGASAIHVIVGAGGRLDHAIANLAVLASPDWAAAAITATVGGSSVWVVRGSVDLPLHIGEPLSLIPMGAPALDVHTDGLEWHLDGDDLSPYSARAVSNVVTSVPVRVTVGTGVVLAVSSPMPTSDPFVVRD